MDNGALEVNASAQQPNQSGQVDQVVNVPDVQGQAQEPTPQFVSRDEFMQALETVRRETQGLVDKNVSRLDKRVAEAAKKADELVELGKVSGMQFTPEQIAQLKDRAVHQALMTTDQPPSNQPVQQQAAQPQATQIDPVTATAQLMMQKAGIALEPNDPEMSLVDRVTDDPAVFLEGVRKAIEAKKQRVTRTVGSPAATPGDVGTGSTPANLIQQYQREIKDARGKGIFYANEIKNRYKQKGVDVDNIKLTW